MSTVHVKVPATSANLGPGFDALGLALGMWLEVSAEVSEATSVVAEGRDAALCGRVERNLILETIADILTAARKPVPSVRLHVKNGIPLGKGCGSSAAAIVAGVLLANELGSLGWTESQVLHEISRIEGHPDNVAAALLGGMVASAMQPDGTVKAVRVTGRLPWRLLLAIPDSALSTEKARGMLPASYSKQDAVLNVQHAALLVAAFATGRGDLLRVAMEDFLHQPYRMEACPLLKALLPLAGNDGILGVALSGAGPSVLIILDTNVDVMKIKDLVIGTAGNLSPELLFLDVADGAEVKRR